MTAVMCGERKEAGKQQGVTNNKHPTQSSSLTSNRSPLVTSPHLMTKRPHSPNTLVFNNMAEPTEGREPKRRRSAPSPLDLNVALAMKPEKNIDVIDDGDVLLVVGRWKGEDKP